MAPEERFLDLADAGGLHGDARTYSKRPGIVEVKPTLPLVGRYSSASVHVGGISFVSH